jgi:hypothetical protein
VQDISPVDVASYGEQITQAAAKPLRSFLTYIRKKSSGNVALAPHLRAKKPSSKTVTVWQGTQTQVTLTAEGHAKLENELANLRICKERRPTRTFGKTPLWRQLESKRLTWKEESRK